MSTALRRLCLTVVLLHWTAPAHTQDRPLVITDVAAIPMDRDTAFDATGAWIVWSELLPSVDAVRRRGSSGGAPASAVDPWRAGTPLAISLARRATGCTVAATVLGGVGGAMVGGILGTLLERAAYGGNPEAGLTGFVLGILVGGAVGARAARKICPEEGGI